PLLIENDWQARTPRPSSVRGIGSIRMRIRHPIDERSPLLSIAAFLLHLPAALYNLRRLVAEHRIAVLNPYFPDLESLPMVLLRRAGVLRGKVILTFQGSDTRHALNSRGLSRLLWKWMLRNADALVFCSRALAEELLAQFEDCRPRAVTIHN